MLFRSSLPSNILVATPSEADARNPLNTIRNSYKALFAAVVLYFIWVSQACATDSDWDCSMKLQRCRNDCRVTGQVPPPGSAAAACAAKCQQDWLACGAPALRNGAPQANDAPQQGSGATASCPSGWVAVPGNDRTYYCRAEPSNRQPFPADFNCPAPYKTDKIKTNTGGLQVFCSLPRN